MGKEDGGGEGKGELGLRVKRMLAEGHRRRENGSPETNVRGRAGDGTAYRLISMAGCTGRSLNRCEVEKTPRKRSAGGERKKNAGGKKEERCWRGRWIGRAES